MIDEQNNFSYKSMKKIILIFKHTKLCVRGTVNTAADLSMLQRICEAQC